MSDQVESNVENETPYEDFTSFDDLDADYSSEQTIIEETPTDVIPEDKGEETAEENKNVLTDESDSEEVKATKEETETEENQSEDITPTEEARKITGRYKEENEEIAVDTVFKHKVDGEEVDVSLQELLNNYSGKVPYDKRFQELSEEKNDFKSQFDNFTKEKDQVNGYINEFGEKMREGKALEALAFLAEFSGQKPHEFKEQLIDQLVPEVDRLRTLSQDQLSNEKLAAENEYLQKKYESDENIRLAEQSQQEFQNRINSLQETHNIPDEDFNNSYVELKDSNFQGEVTPEVVADYYQHKTAFSLASELVGKVDSTLASNNNIIDTVQKMIYDNPSFTSEDYLELIEKVYGSVKKDSSQAVSNKILDADTNTKVNSKQKPKDEYENYLDFEELM
jgi:hypothetical protein